MDAIFRGIKEAFALAGVIGLGILWALFTFGPVYIAYHFISKYW